MILPSRPEAHCKTFAIGLGELLVSRNCRMVLVCYGLGSCIGVAAYDTVAKVGGMAHVVLPDSSLGQSGDSGAKFADTGIPRLIQEMCSLGAVQSRIVVKLAGGAQMLAVAALAGKLDIGRRNVEAVQTALSKLGTRVVSTDIGGNYGRTMQLLLPEGKVVVSSIGLGENEL